MLNYLLSKVSNGVVDVRIAGGRLTTQSGVGVITGDRSGQSTIYYTPFAGNQISLYNGTIWVTMTFTEASLALSGLVANTVYDVFVYNNGGTLALELSAAWSSTSTPTDSIVAQDGILVKSSNKTRRQVGTIYTSATNTVEDTRVNRGVWSSQNQVVRNLSRNSSDNHNYQTGTWREWDNGANGPHHLIFVSGSSQNIRFGGRAEIQCDTLVSFVSMALNSASSQGQCPASVAQGASYSTNVGMTALGIPCAVGLNTVYITQLSFANSGTYKNYDIYTEFMG